MTVEIDTVPDCETDSCPRIVHKDADALPLISVVVPSFEHGRFIERTLLSVLEQAYPRLELIVMDGGSTDGTVDILRRYRALHPAVVSFVSEKDRGHAHAVNKGLTIARGDILGWLNSDDTYEPGALERAAEEFRNHDDCDLIYGRAWYIAEHDETIRSYPCEPEFDFGAFAEACYICQPSVFMRRRVIDCGYLLDETMRYCCDYDYWIRLGRHFEFRFVDMYLANARIHPAAKSISARGALIEEAASTVQRHYHYLPLGWALAMAHDRHGTGTPDPAPGEAAEVGPAAVPTPLRTYATAARLCLQGNFARPAAWPRLARGIVARAVGKARRRYRRPVAASSGASGQ